MSEWDDFKDTIGNPNCCGDNGKCRHCGHIYNNYRTSRYERYAEQLIAKAKRKGLNQFPSKTELFDFHMEWDRIIITFIMYYGLAQYRASQKYLLENVKAILLERKNRLDTHPEHFNNVNHFS